MHEIIDSSSETEYKMLGNQSFSEIAEDIITLFKNKLRREGFVSHEIDYMVTNGFKKPRMPKERSYPFH